MKTHEQYIRENPDLVRRNLATMIAERDAHVASMNRARSDQGRRNWEGKVRFAEKMIARYEDDLRIIAQPAHEPTGGTMNEQRFVPAIQEQIDAIERMDAAVNDQTTKHTYTVAAGSPDTYYPRYVDADTLTICENYAQSWIKSGPDHWAEIVDNTGRVVQYHGEQTTQRPAPTWSTHDIDCECDECNDAPDTEQTDLSDIPFPELHWSRTLRQFVTIPLSAALLALSLATAHAKTPTWQQPVPASFAAGCTITGAWEDGSKLAYCEEDGSTIAYDPDGQLYVNDDNVPLRRPGQWYAVTN